MWYNPATWTPVDAAQDNIARLTGTYSSSNLTNSFTGAGGQAQPTETSGTYDSGSQATEPYTLFPGQTLGKADWNNTYIPESVKAPSNKQTAVPTDPFAKYGGKGAYDAQIGEFNQNKQNVLDTANMSRDSLYDQGRSSILDFIGGAQQLQQGIDQKRANAQFSLQEGKGDIMDMVGRGVRSGGVMLANKNAASSGAAGQIARAYGELGNREARDVGNQFALENQGIDLEQNNLVNSYETQKRKIDEFKMSNTDQIVNSAKSDLQVLEARRVGASLPELFQIDQLSQQIKDATMAKLGELDGLLQSERAKITPMGQQQVMAKANDMRTAGTGGPQMFDFNTNAANMQTTGAPIAGAELPIYSNLALNKRREA